MKKYFDLLMLLFCLAAAFSFYACGEGGTDTGNPTTGGEGTDSGDDGVDAEAINEEQACLDAGGEWMEFSNGCVDSCESQREEDIACTAAFTLGCECGEDRCWNNETFECTDL